MADFEYFRAEESDLVFFFPNTESPVYRKGISGSFHRCKTLVWNPFRPHQSIKEKWLD